MSAAALKQGINPDHQDRRAAVLLAAAAGRKSAVRHQRHRARASTTSRCPTACASSARTAARRPRWTSRWRSPATPRSPRSRCSSIGAAKLAAEAKAFGLDTAPLSVPLKIAPSTIGNEGELANDHVALAQTAFGQRNVAVTPLQAAMIAARWRTTAR